MPVVDPVGEFDDRERLSGVAVLEPWEPDLRAAALPGGGGLEVVVVWHRGDGAAQLRQHNCVHPITPTAEPGWG
jgi:hypothetical protein